MEEILVYPFKEDEKMRSIIWTIVMALCLCLNISFLDGTWYDMVTYSLMAMASFVIIGESIELKKTFKK